MTRDHFRWEEFPSRHKRVRTKCTGRYGRVCVGGGCGRVVERWHVARMMTQEVVVKTLDSRGTPKVVGIDFGEADDPAYKCKHCGTFYDEADWLELEVREVPPEEVEQ